MNEPLKLLMILAHPDDESLGTGGTLAKYGGEGVETYLITATRGERGWFGAAADYPGPTELGRIREAELRAASQVLGLHGVTFLDYIDGDLDQAEPGQVIGKIAAVIRQIRPQVVVTFDLTGAYGHPDHIAISQFASAACVAATNPAYPGIEPWPAHQVSKLYYRISTQPLLDVYEEAFGDLVMHVDGLDRRPHGWPAWSITTQIDTMAYWQQVWAAISCHRSQLPGYERLKALPAEHWSNLWGHEHYYRMFSLVNGGRTMEVDLFEGIRSSL
ncbi:MAG: PIG-L family deacetylase [Anaerolineae bacterium]|nr:PIG-L family deacetylase [Anaerolineae bacterium]